LTGEKAESLSTQLLVVADGARSELRGALGIQASDRDYGQVAVVANIQVAPERAGCVAYERFTPEGPVAILPGRDGLYTVVLARTSESAPTVMSMSDEEILDLVQSAFGFRLGRFMRIGQRFAYPLHLVTADSIVAERAVVIGNAANGLHPVAAQGFNLGLRDVASLGEVIADGYGMKAATFDPGAADVLTSYCDWRRSDQRKVVGFTDGLIRMFGIPGAPASIGRGLGLAAFDMLPGAKQELARQTMGLSGRLSRLARGLRL
jgi:2-octaprenyl-6-methoxyphenol hydroxylase